MKCWTQTLCCLMALACADCAGTIDDPASFESFASESRGGGGSRDAGAAPDPVADAQTQTDAASVEPPLGEPDADTDEPAPVPELDAGSEVDTGTPDPGPIVSSCDFKGLMMSKCGAASCHGGPTASTGLDLTSDGLRARMANVNGGGACSDKPMINEDDPEQSTLYLIVTGNACGLRMPLGGTLSATEQACILEWITGP
jgi:hypothetical protein